MKKLLSIVVLGLLSIPTLAMSGIFINEDREFGLKTSSKSGFKFHMNNIAAAIGLSQIPHMDSILNKHKSNGLLYEQLFKDQSFDPRAATPKERTLYFNTN